MNRTAEAIRTTAPTSPSIQHDRRRPERSIAPGRETNEAVARLLREQAPEQVESLQRLLDDTKTPARGGQNPPGLDQALWGRAPSREDVAAGAVAGLRLQFAERRAVEEVSLSRAEVADLLGVSAQAVTDALEARHLMGLRRGHRWLIPAWQLEADAERGLLPGIAALAEAFPGGLVTLSGWVVRPRAELGGRSPRDAMASGEGERVTALARSLTAAG